MATRTSSQDGAWNATATWNGDPIPVTGDDVNVLHDVNVPVNSTVGLGTTGTNSVIITSAGTLTIDEDITLIIQGDTFAEGDIVMALGSELHFDTTTLSKLDMRPGSTNAALKINGTVAKPCLVQSINTGRGRLIGNSNVDGSGRLLAYHTTFKALGDLVSPANLPAIGWSQDDTDDDLYPWIMEDCVLDDVVQVSWMHGITSDHTAKTGRVELTRVRDINPPTPPAGAGGDFGHIVCSAFLGMTSTLTDCDFTGIVAYIHPDDWTATDTLFRQRLIRRDGIGNAFNGGEAGEFLRCTFVKNEADDSLIHHGETLTDCVVISKDTSANPHTWLVLGGFGDTTIDGCIIYCSTTAASASGDGPVIQQPDAAVALATQSVYIQNCIILPNGNGTGAADSNGATIASNNVTVSSLRIRATNNTAWNGTSVLGSVFVGETNPSAVDTILEFKSNLIVGSSGGTALKISDGGNSVEDTFRPEYCSNNGSYRIGAGSQSPGVGYGAFTFSGGGPHNVGVGDIDGEDPVFVDWDRTPETWSGGTIDDALNMISFTDPANNLQDMLDYIRAGWQPTNENLRGAGDPSAGSPDIGAVPLAIIVTGTPSEIPAMEYASANQVIQHASARAYHLATHTWSHPLPLTDGVAVTTTLGTVLVVPTPARPPRADGLVTVDFRGSGGFGTGESMLVVVKAQGADGSVRTVFSATVTASVLTAAGIVDIIPIATVDQPIVAGDLLSLVTTYTDGTPNAPDVSVVVQLA